MSAESKQIQFIGIDPTELIQQLKTSLIAEIIPHLEIKKPNNDLGLLSRNEVMNLLNISSSTLSRWQKDNVIPFIKIGEGESCKVFFKRSEIETMLNIKSN
ncbi:Helix-turn-helix domain-containing protein [Chishuiella changwenlii]|uniref:Helix-turn-helix domain-containing protein n=1 Tax=Chishuiella changwenlii TaxID=1434701 RepID=A0A1M6ZX20_9FLAO|nr:helix-turn-helix domain-containing protein [Chishuiella changwenlii]GGE92303.1 hypothetical protein GCM10010984_07440 [Chishuiella changwenlii]SHL34974.1 Helix-turn-helix domain-containing protein [Chishuiella changwenlii]